MYLLWALEGGSHLFAGRRSHGYHDRSNGTKNGAIFYSIHTNVPSYSGSGGGKSGNDEGVLSEGSTADG